MEWVIALVMLTGMELVLGIDNIIFLSILVGALPPEKRRLGRIVGLSLALAARMGLLLAIRWVMSLDRPIFKLSSLGFLPPDWLKSHTVDAVTWHDLVLIGGGLFLIGKSVVEIHEKMNALEEHEDKPRKAPRSLVIAIAQIVLLDLVFSLDSIISAIGMVKEVWIMIVAMSIAVVTMGIFSGPISSFIEKNSTFKMLALTFLVLIGAVLIAEGAGTHISRAYIYTAMAFSMVVELLNMRARRKRERARRASRASSAPEPSAHSVV
ncbi:MAG: Integral rane protein TerC family protein [Labilithrix sp.]|nr:Integral rane protein TerC family protein [Labilithrix sp.]